MKSSVRVETFYSLQPSYLLCFIVSLTNYTYIKYISLSKYRSLFNTLSYPFRVSHRKLNRAVIPREAKNFFCDLIRCFFSRQLSELYFIAFKSDA